jgi:hypothetical protein
MYVAYLLRDDTKDCLILIRPPLWLSFHNHESVWMVPGTLARTIEPLRYSRPFRAQNGQSV